ncbi:MAG: hypothetical protein VZS44_00670 [Bacilli bacterium]|nr:hypothetical protein [Bacilli bacterium]
MKEVIRDIKNINMYLNDYKNNIEEFAKSNANSIENIKKKCLTLSKE